MPSGDDPMGGNRFSLGTTRSVCPEIMRQQRDEIMMRFHLIASPSSAALRRAQVGKGQRAQLFTVEINKPQPTPMRNQARRQRIVAERSAAEVGREAANISERVDLDEQQIEL